MEPKDKSVNYTLKHSASLMPANLTGAEGHLAYVNNNPPKCHIIDTKNISDKTRSTWEATYDDVMELTEVKYVQAFDTSYLLICFIGGVQMCNKEGKRLHHHIKSSDWKKKYREENTYYKGVAAVRCLDGYDLICVGNSEGFIHTVKNAGSKFKDDILSKIPGVAGIAVLQGYESTLCVGDTNGDVYLLSIENTTDANLVSKFETEDTVPPTCMDTVMRPGKTNESILLVGFGSGKVEGISLTENSKLFTLHAHARWLSGICAHPDCSVFATVGEDCVLNVWEISTDENMKVVFSKKLADNILTGVCFMGENSREVGVVAYDSASLTIYSIY
eukprot:CAMPEP_0114984070 /NCGR_PEP_ID=MMETSP0216-20121206/7064_1 /TAXON_ID=223996 /ORGANISM="Protocruzia adherens, Strain Boccale" /LENGTH=331 /DNA_ID=CAMNT_0002346149 /DNA_START=19 /DNA_END=1014 /DNA_ORIENTATION=+